MQKIVVSSNRRDGDKERGSGFRWQCVSTNGGFPKALPQ